MTGLLRPRPGIRRRLAGPDGAHLPMLCLVTSYHLAGWSSLRVGAPTEVADALGPGLHWAWIVMLLTGPALTVTGLCLTDQWTGTVLRIAGGLAILGALGTYLAAIATLDGATAGMWIVAGLVAATGWHLDRDLGLLWRIERVARRKGA